LVDGGNVVPEVVVVDAVDLPVDLVGAGSVQRTISACSGVSEAWRENNQLREVAAVEGSVLKVLAFDAGSLRGRCRVQGERRGIDLNSGGGLGQVQLDRQIVDITGCDWDFVHLDGLEARCGRGDGIGAEL
jgi:hypothetical protein